MLVDDARIGIRRAIGIALLGGCGTNAGDRQKRECGGGGDGEHPKTSKKCLGDHVLGTLSLSCPKGCSDILSCSDILVICRRPAPGARAIAAGGPPLLVDLANDLAIAGEQ